jgi:hypothetical protein
MSKKMYKTRAENKRKKGNKKQNKKGEKIIKH